jgi:pyruvate carboxylase subunit B
VRYLVEVSGRRFTVEVDGDSVRLDGRPLEVRLEAAGASPLRRLLTPEGARELVALPGEGAGRWALQLGSDLLDVVVSDERKRVSRAIRARSSPAQQAGGVLAAPMPGLVVRVLVAEGQSVDAGDPLVVLEAMKMENELKATSKGVVRRVRVGPGERVERGAELVELESPR